MMKKKDNMRREIVKAVTAAGIIVCACILGQVFVSCSPRLAPPAEIRDSVRVEIRERLVHDTATFFIEKEVEKIVVRDSVSHLENKYAVSDAEVDTLGFLHHSLESRPQYIKVPYTVEVHDTTIMEHQAETIIQKENYVTKWQSFSMILGWILGGLLLIGIILWAVKKFVFKR